MKSILICLVLFVGTFCAKAQEISVTITDDLDSLPIVGARVDLFEWGKKRDVFIKTLYSDTLGIVHIDSLKKKNYRLVIMAEGFENTSEYFPLVKQEKMDFSIHMRYTIESKYKIMGGTVCSAAEMKTYLKEHLAEIDTTYGNNLIQERSKLSVLLAETVYYPDIAREEGMQGRVYVMIITDEQQVIQKMAVMRGVEPELDVEALFALFRIHQLPFTPMDHKGLIAYALPISFRLE